MVRVGTPTEEPLLAVTENFTPGSFDAGTEEDTSEYEWTYDAEYSYSAGAFFVEFLEAEDGSAVCVFGGAVYVGAMTGSGGEFTWSEFNAYSETQTHISGYAWREEYAEVLDGTLSFALDGDTLTGSLVDAVAERARYEESDRWDADEVGRDEGRIPASSWLEPEYVANDPDDDDCESDPCWLQIDDGLTYTYELVGVRFRGDPDEGILYAGQGLGY